MGSEPEERRRSQPPECAGSVLRCSRSDRDGSAVIRVAGEVDWATAPVLRRVLARILAARPPKVVLDLTDVAFLDSSGLGELIRAHRQAKARGGWVRLVGPRPIVRKILHMTDVDRVLHVHDTLDLALTDAGRPETRPVAPPLSLGSAYGIADWVWPGGSGVGRIGLN